MSTIQVALLLFGAALLSRIWTIDYPAVVVWDEAHFGLQAGMYLKGRYFVDVHPPLAKLMYAAVGGWFGWDGTFNWKEIGEPIPTRVPHSQMRLVAALHGAVCVPLAYLISLKSLQSAQTALLVGLCFLLDWALTIQSRIICLDPMLLCYILAATYCLMLLWDEDKKFGYLHRDEFSYVVQALLGLFMGMAVSVKMVGLFFYLIIGLYVAADLYLSFSDRFYSLRKWMVRFVAYAFFLIIVPCALYIALWVVHIRLLRFSGGDDGFMSSSYQSDLIGNYNYGLTTETVEYVAYGSLVSLAAPDAIDTEVYLTSWDHSYPREYEGGSVSTGQQLVTGYRGAGNANGFWIFMDPKTEEPSDPHLMDPRALGPLRFVKDGDIVAIRHIGGKYLHTRDVASFSDGALQEVSGHQWNYQGEPMSVGNQWKVEIFEKGDPKDGDKLHVISTFFRLKSVFSNTYLELSGNQLPGTWGFGHEEVTSSLGADDHVRNVWHVMDAKDSRMRPSTILRTPKLSTFQKIVEIHRRIASNNASMTGRHHMSTKPWTWPVLPTGYNYYSGFYSRSQIFFNGNPLIWIIGFLSFFLVVATDFVYFACGLRGVIEIGPETARALSYGRFFYIMYAIHYFPYFLVQRNLFVHTYLSALMFSIFCIGWSIDFYLTGRRKTTLLVGYALAVLATFIFASPVIYCSRGNAEHAAMLRFHDGMAITDWAVKRE
eukprot:Clim_evm52s119 gene=Clim_evmTU52s119